MVPKLLLLLLSQPTYPQPQPTPSQIWHTSSSQYCNSCLNPPTKPPPQMWRTSDFPWLWPHFRHNKGVANVHRESSWLADWITPSDDEDDEDDDNDDEEMSGGCTHLKAGTTLEAETQSLSSLEEETGRLNLIMMWMIVMWVLVKHESWYYMRLCCIIFAILYLQWSVFKARFDGVYSDQNRNHCWCVMSVLSVTSLFDKHRCDHNNDEDWDMLITFCKAIPILEACPSRLPQGHACYS